MASLFISYSRKDKEAARKLTEALKGQEFDFWIDWEGIEPTVDWWREIEKGIEGADNFLFLISPDSASSNVCKQEIEHAVKNGKRLIPVVVRDTKAEEVASELRPLNWIFLRDADDFQSAFGKLITAIQTDYIWVQFHRRLQVKALEWERSAHENSLLLRGKDLQDAESQLVKNSSKEPHPTDLQREYVLKSRQTADKQRRLLISVAIGAAIVMAALAIFGFVQAGLATTNARKEQAASTLANANARTAESASTQAIENEQEAKRQAQVALARQLSAQAQLLFGESAANQQSAVLLAIQSMKTLPSVEAGLILQHNTLAYPIANLVDNSGVSSVVFSSDGKYIVTGSSDGVVILWDAASYQEIKRVRQASPVTSVAISSSDEYVAAGGDDGTVMAWAFMSGKEMMRAKHDKGVTSIAFSPDGHSVISGSLDQTARLWEVMTGKEMLRLQHNDIVTSVAFGSDGAHVVSGCWDMRARVWDIKTGKEIASWNHTDSVVSVAFHDPFIAIGGFDGTVAVWEYDLDRKIIQLENAGGSVYVAFSADATYIVFGNGQGDVSVRGTFRGEEIAHIIDENGVTSVAFSPDDKYVITGGTTARVWEVFSRQVTFEVAEEMPVYSELSTPDGKRQVSIGVDGTILIRVASNGTEVARMIQDNGISGLSMSPDGKYVASGSGDGTVHVWDSSTGKEISRATHRNRVTSVGFSEDGKFVVSKSDDGDVRMWLYRPEDLIADACARVSRNLTRAEWVQYLGDESYQPTCPNLPMEPEATPIAPP